MSIKHGLLALLRAEAKYGYQLRGEFEAATGATWPLNIGQVYTTLTRLERDGLVAAAPARGTATGRSMYEITEAGRVELTSWFETPVTRESRPRDELAIKLALALAVPGVNVTAGRAAPAELDHAGPAGAHPAEAAGPRRATSPGGWCWSR